MKSINDSSIHLENNACNQGIQVGNNSGNITQNQGPSEADMMKIAEMMAGIINQCQNENSIAEGTEKQKWFRSDTKQEVTPDDLIKFGNMTVQFDGNLMCGEVTLPNHKTIYAEFDTDKNMATNIVAEGFPQEYTVNIPKEFVIDTQSFQQNIQGQLYRVKIDKLKFGGEAIALYDLKENKLQSFSAKAPAGMKANVDPSKKEVTFIKAESIF